jgi:hypothetical protein
MPVEHKGRVTKVVPLSKETLEFCDWLIDGVTLAANHPNLAKEAAKIQRAKEEVAAELLKQGGVPLSIQRDLT